MDLQEYLPIKSHIAHINKGLGQHFLIDNNILEKIASSIDLTNKNIVEIGGGIGNLTIYALQKNPNTYTIIEKDTYYANYLNTLFTSINVIPKDCMLFKDSAEVLIGNLPYNISTEFIEKVVLNKQFKEGLFLIQKEVALRLCSPVKRKTYGPISVLCQLLCKPKILFNVSASCFFPAPKVESSVVYLAAKDLVLPNSFLKYLHKAFLHRRKKYYGDLRPDQIDPPTYYGLFKHNS